MHTKKSVCDRLLEVKEQSQEQSTAWHRDVLLEPRDWLHQVTPSYRLGAAIHVAAASAQCFTSWSKDNMVA